ncbi:MAG: helix-turn-helix transcriptional regulator [Pseudonocardiales bacterium]
MRLHLGTQLAAYRKAAGISQPELGAALGKTRTLISKIEHGRRGMPAEQWKVAEGALVAEHTELTQAEQAYRDRCRARRRAAQRAEAQAELDALRACPAPQLHRLSGPAAPPELELVSGELAEELLQVVTRLARPCLAARLCSWRAGCWRPSVWLA